MWSGCGEACRTPLDFAWGISAQGESETRGSCGRGPRFRHGTNANPEAFEVNLAERHQAGVEITPDKQQQKGHSGVVFVLDGVHHCCGEVEAQRDLGKWHPAGAFAIGLL